MREILESQVIFKQLIRKILRYNTSMNGSIGFRGWVKILLPLVCAVSFAFYPRDLAFESVLKTMGAERPDPVKIAAVLEHEPWRVDAMESLAEIHLSSGDFPAAIELLEKGHEQENLTPEGLKMLSSAYMNTGQISRELDINLEHLKLSPQDRNLYWATIQLQARLGLREEEKRTLESLLNTFPDDAEGLYTYGLILYSEGDEDGLKKVKKAAELDPFLAEKSAVLQAAEYQASLSGNSAHSLLERGRGLGAVGAWDLAGEVFARVVQLDPQYAEGWAYLGESHQQTNAGDGREELEKAGDLDSESNAVKGLTALYYRRHGQFEKALALIKQAAENEPDEPAWQVEWANTLAEKGDLQEALDHYRAAIEIDPQNVQNRYLLARFCLTYSIEVRETGLPTAREGAALEPGNPRWPDLMGRILLALGDTDLAERSFRQALTLDPANFSAGLHLAQLFLDRGDFDQAYPLVKGAAEQEFDPGSREIAIRLLKRFFNEGF